MDPLQRLEAIEAIRQTKARYFRSIDTKDRAGLAAVFTRDAVLDHREAEMEEIVEGNEAIAEFIIGVLQGVTTVHHGHMMEVEVLSPTTAHAITAMEDKLWWAEGPIEAMHGYGHYHEDYVLEDGAWRISLNRLTRLRVDHVLRGPQ
jgi:hypothetical protein